MKKIINRKIIILISVLLFLPLFVSCFSAPPTNQSPTITSTPITTATVDELYTYDVDATDPDGDSLTYSLITNPAGMTIDSTTGVISWTSTSGQIGDHNVTVKVTDGELFDTQSFVIAVNSVSTSNLKLTPFSQSVTLGNQATINVVVEDVIDLKGASITLNFDASKLQYTSSADGGFIPGAFLPPETVDNVNGSVILDLASLTSDTSGTGTIMTVAFNTIATGVADITFGATDLRDKLNGIIVHTTGIGCSIRIN